MFRKILVPLDGSELAEYAIKPAFTLAAHNRSELTLLRVPIVGDIVSYGLSPQDLVWRDEVLRTNFGEAEHYLAQVRDHYQQTGVTIRPVTVSGDPASTIVDYARAESIDLIVMSTHGRTGISRWVLGSITERVLRQAPCPVLVIRNSQPIERALITLDGSPLSQLALAPGVSVASQLGAQLTLLTIATSQSKASLESAFTLAQTGPEPVHSECGSTRELAEAYLNSLVHQGLTAEMTSSEPHLEVMEGPPAHAILEYAEANNITLLIMATHGRSGLLRWVYGSVTEKVLRNSRAALLVVRPPRASLR